MATFVLVHGAGLGGWCWRDVVDLLMARGHDVHTPTLTGMGERSHLGPADLDTHVDDVARALFMRDLRGVHLVLHGYAGAIAGPLAARTDRLASITYLSGFVVLTGENVPSAPAIPTVTDPQAQAWMQARLTPWAAPHESVSYDSGPLQELRQIYLRHTQPPAAPLEPSWRRALDAGWETHEITTGSLAMITAPRQTARLLESAGPQDVLPPAFPASPRIALW